MNIKVIKEKLLDKYEVSGYATDTIEIFIDSDADPHLQKETIIHEVVENYCRNWNHQNIDELTSFIMEALDQLEGLNERD